jgi:tetratricopeptide (TPR) repeat protein
MPIIFFEILMSVLNWKPINSITIINNLKVESSYFFKQKKYSNAEQSLQNILKNSSNEPEVSINLAKVLFIENKLTESKKLLEKIKNSTDIQVSVQANLYLGLIYCKQNDSLKAITQFENALIKDPKSTESRYNLELLKKAFKNKPDTSAKQNENANQKKIAKFVTSNESELTKNSNKTEFLKRLTKINLTESQVQNIFEAIGKNELKYIQQRKEKRNTSKGNYQNW